MRRISCDFDSYIKFNFDCSWYNDEVQYSKILNEYLGAGIGIFQGLSNFAINGMTLIVLYCGGVLLDSGQITPGDLMSFLMATQTIQRYHSYILLCSFIKFEFFMKVILPFSLPVFPEALH